MSSLSEVRRKPRRRVPLAGLVGAFIVVFWLVMAVAGPWLAAYDVGGEAGDAVFAPMSAQYPLGTDYLGRDMLSRILHGAPYTIGVALAAVLVASVGGTTLAMFAAAALGGSRPWLGNLGELALQAAVVATLVAAARAVSPPARVSGGRT